jgi:hypothetical protein
VSKTRRFIIAVGCAWLACTWTSVTVADFFPTFKSLKGKISNDVYTAPDSGFSVAVPHKKDSYEFKYMKTSEGTSADGEYVSFGPAAYDQSIYRVEILRRSEPTDPDAFDHGAQQVIPGFKQLMEQRFAAPLNQLDAQTLSVKGRKSDFWRFAQHVPPGRLGNKETLLTSDVYVIDCGRSVAFVSVMAPEMPPIVAAQIEITPQAFAESVEVR